MSLPFIKSDHKLTLHVVDECKQRIDHYLQKQFPAYTRSFFQRAIEDGLVLVNEKPVKKPGHMLKAGDVIELQFPAERKVDASTLAHANLGIELYTCMIILLLLTNPQDY